MVRVFKLPIAAILVFSVFFLLISCLPDNSSVDPVDMNNIIAIKILKNNILGSCAHDAKIIDGDKLKLLLDNIGECRKTEPIFVIKRSMYVDAHIYLNDGSVLKNARISCAYISGFIMLTPKLYCKGSKNFNKIVWE